MLCPRCNQPIPDSSKQCGSCGANLAVPPQISQNPFGDAGPYAPPQGGYPPPQYAGDDAALRMLIPIGRSVWAIAAGYLGLISLAACFLGPLAVLCGIIAIINIRRDPKLHGLPRAIFGIVSGLMGTLGLVVVVLLMIFGDRM